jgi:hypothetical protein
MTVVPRRSVLAATVAAVLMAIALAAPSGASALQKGFWGPASINGQSQFPIYKDLGVTLYQMALSWPSVAPTRPANPRDPADPAYHWPADVDFALQQASQNNMRVLLMLVNSPSWANGGHAQPGYAPRPSDFADFARAAARRYPAVRHWMIWGEPTRRPNFIPLVPETKFNKPLSKRQQAAPHRYARILDAAYGALKSVRRSNLVIGGNSFTVGDIRPLHWIQNLRLPNGKPPRMDLYGHNPFSFRHPSLKNPPSSPYTVDFSDLARFGRQVDRNLGRPGKRHIRLFLSEFTIPTDLPDAEFNFHVTRAVQSRWITDAFRVAKQIGAYGLGWIHLYDDPPDPTHQHGVVQGGLIDATGAKKPGYFAFQKG